MSAAQRSAASADWGTPPEVLESVRECLGGIGLDPCSSHTHQRRVQARHYFYSFGLEQSWEERYGDIFCNPPGSSRGVQPWWQKFTDSVSRPRAGIWLGFNMNQLAYLDPNPLVWAHWIFIPRKRIKFVGAGNNPPHNSYLVGKGCDVAALSQALRLRGFEGTGVWL